MVIAYALKKSANESIQTLKRSKTAKYYSIIRGKRFDVHSQPPNAYCLIIHNAYHFHSKCRKVCSIKCKPDFTPLTRKRRSMQDCTLCPTQKLQCLLFCESRDIIIRIKLRNHGNLWVEVRDHWSVRMAMVVRHPLVLGSRAISMLQG